MFAEPSKEVPPIVLAVSRVVAVVAFPAKSPVNVAALTVPLVVVSIEYEGLAVLTPNLLLVESQTIALASCVNPPLPSDNCICPDPPEEVPDAEEATSILVMVTTVPLSLAPIAFSAAPLFWYS